MHIDFIMQKCPLLDKKQFLSEAKKDRKTAQALSSISYKELLRSIKECPDVVVFGEARGPQNFYCGYSSLSLAFFMLASGSIGILIGRLLK